MGRGMATEALVLSVAIAAGSFLTATAAILSFGRGLRRRISEAGAISRPETDTVVFLFDDTEIVDMTPCARRLLAAAPPGSSGWVRFLTIMSPRFPGLGEQLARLAQLGRIELRATDGLSNIRAEWHDGIARVRILDADEVSDRPTIDGHGLRAMERELADLRAVAAGTTALIWRQTQAGTVTWANQAYLDLAHDAEDGPRGWPPRAIFDPEDLVQAAKTGRVTRMAAELGTGRRWFACHACFHGDEIVITATDESATVAAEDNLRSFTQTLAKTFSHLAIGLAVFDRGRQLSIFNPALTDLTGVSPGLLTRRPDLVTFLDLLRDRHVIPEPRNYKEWRRTLAQMETGAADGTFSETWSLSGGRTYRMTGRPHPDGAIAFLLEDISAEMSLTRRFRAELDLSQAVLDAARDAVAVFTMDGTLTLSNAAYAELWGDDPSSTLGDVSITAATQSWARKCAYTPVWGDIRDFVGQMHERAEWSAELRLADGRALHCRIVPISGGATMVAFEEAPPQRLVAPAPVATPDEDDPMDGTGRAVAG